MPEEDTQNSEFQYVTVGTRLRSAREAAGLSREEIATRTKIAERHLISLEEDRFLDVGGRAYAVGFSRAYARAVGLDEGEIAQAVRDMLAQSEEPEQRTQPDTFEPGDPARVPDSRLAWLAVAGALAVIAAIYILWRSFLSPSVSLPDLTQEEAQQAAAASESAEPAAAATPAVPSGPVVFTATEQNVWIKFMDASGKSLMQKQMAKGESYTVPTDADGPKVTTGRPDAFTITIGGTEVPKLNDRPIIVRNAPVSADALLSRGNPEPAASRPPAPATQAARTTASRTVQTRPAAPTPTPVAIPSPTPAPRAASPTPSPSPRKTPLPAPTPTPTPNAAPTVSPPAASPTPAASRAPAPAAPAPKPTPSAAPTTSPVSAEASTVSQ